MRNIVLSFIIFLTMSGTCGAQGWPFWADKTFGDPRSDYDRGWQDRARGPEKDRKPHVGGGDLRDGGLRPEIAPVAPSVVAFPHDFPANSILIDTGGRKLYYVLADNRAYQYPISVGREGFNWTGTETISRKQAWPDWYPPAEMRERDPSLPEKMAGGLKNPLGAMALYLGNTLYRIHGTNDTKSIGQAQSSGCFRMLNSAVLHLASITEVGTTVSVVSSMSARQEVSQAPKVSPRQESQVSPQPLPNTTSNKAPSVPDYRALRNYTLGQR